MKKNIPAEHNFDAIVIGSGISGGWAAKELCEGNLKTLLLERGRDVKHIVDYPTANKDPWEFPHAGELSHAFRKENPIASRAAGIGESNQHFFTKDAEQVYIQEKPFDWIRGYQVGGKSLIWGRACQRWSHYEFTGPERMKYGMKWPIGYDDVADWYSYVERYIGVCGSNDHLAAMPDGEFLPPFEFNKVESHVREAILKHYKNRYMVHARWAHLTEAKEIHKQQGRVSCKARNACMSGCPFGGYFSSVSSTIPWAQRTGNLTLKPNSLVKEIIYDEQTKKAAGVRVLDTQSNEETIYYARIIFLNASTLNSNLILLNSKSERFPNGLGNDHQLLGKYIGFHNYRGSVSGDMPGFTEDYYFGRNPSENILANYVNLDKQDRPFVGGYTTFIAARRHRGIVDKSIPEVGAAFKDNLSLAGPWFVYMYMQGETIMKESNQVSLSPTAKDKYGMPQLITSVDYDENDEKMLEDFLTQSSEMLKIAGCENIKAVDNKIAPGLDIHEMGGVRMGTDPQNSMLNKWNQIHSCPNVFVTDGACMTSTGNQSPSILYMALTARACKYAIEEMKKGNL